MTHRTGQVDFFIYFISLICPLILVFLNVICLGKNVYKNCGADASEIVSIYCHYYSLPGSYQIEI